MDDLSRKRLRRRGRTVEGKTRSVRFGLMTLLKVVLAALLCHGATGFGWFTPSQRSTTTRNVRPVAVAPKKDSSRPAAAATPQVYHITSQSAPSLQESGLPRSRTALNRNTATDGPDANGIVKPTKRIVVVLPAKKTKASALPPTQASKALPKAASAAPDPKLYEHEYWCDPRIHTWGNVGLSGLLHAICAPLATYAIDSLSYGGVNVRKQVQSNIPAGASVLDLCCGTGFSSAPQATGVDTSREMLAVAKLRRPDCKFEFGNAESYGETDSFDVVTMMFATHESARPDRRR